MSSCLFWQLILTEYHLAKSSLPPCKAARYVPATFFTAYWVAAWSHAVLSRAAHGLDSGGALFQRREARLDLRRQVSPPQHLSRHTGDQRLEEVCAQWSGHHLRRQTYHQSTGN